MAGAISEITLEFHGALAERFSALGRRHGSRTRVAIALSGQHTVAGLLTTLCTTDDQYAHLFDVERQRLPELVEAVLNDRAIELQGGLDATLEHGDVLTFLPAHAGG